jgi:hypothetical protein
VEPPRAAPLGEERRREEPLGEERRREEPPPEPAHDPAGGERRGWFGEPGGFGTSSERGEFRVPGGFTETGRVSGAGAPGSSEAPPAGADRGGGPPPPRPLPDLSAVLAILDAVRAAVPAELQQQFTALLREILLAVRALIDRYLERLDGRPREARVEDIPID